MFEYAVTSIHLPPSTHTQRQRNFILHQNLTIYKVRKSYPKLNSYEVFT
jgi:hypothetical protein